MPPMKMHMLSRWAAFCFARVHKQMTRALPEEFQRVAPPTGVPHPRPEPHWTARIGPGRAAAHGARQRESTQPVSAGKQAGNSGNLRNISRIPVCKLGGKATLPPLTPAGGLVISPPPEPPDSASSVARGEPLFSRYCSVCHGPKAVGGGVIPDLGASNFLGNHFFYNIVLDGALQDAGMVSFKAALSSDD